MVDVGCGTGALAFESLARNAKRVVCADVSELMLDVCRSKALAGPFGEDRIACHLLGHSSSTIPGMRLIGRDEFLITGSPATGPCAPACAPFHLDPANLGIARQSDPAPRQS